MFGKVKKWFGIEGTKLRLHVLDHYPRDVQTINGELEVQSKRVERINDIQVQFIEVYTRGRGEDKRIDEFILGSCQYQHSFQVSEGNSKMLFFKLAFEPVQSAMDQRASKGFLQRNLIGLMKSMKGVNSDFYLKAVATVDGNTWQPRAKTKIFFE